MKDQLQPIFEIPLLAVALIILLALANYLYDAGLFSSLPVSRIASPPLLIALTPLRTPQKTTLPVQTPLIAAAHARGVEEKPAATIHLGPDHISRGELVALHLGPLTTSPSLSYSGIILDVAHRATEPARLAWQKRLAHIPDVQVHLVTLSDTLQLPFPHRFDAPFSRYIARRRAFRKLSKNVRKLQREEKKIKPRYFIRAVSTRKARVMNLVPLTSDFPFQN